VRQNALSPDGSILAAAGTGVSNAPGSLVLWDVATGQPLRTLTGQGWMNSVEFSRDGRWLATSSVDRTVKVWEVATGQAAETLLGHEREVNAVVFSPDGQAVAAAGEDGTVRIWPRTW
jgi:WD40 repeat protein